MRPDDPLLLLLREAVREFGPFPLPLPSGEAGGMMFPLEAFPEDDGMFFVDPLLAAMSASVRHLHSGRPL